MVDLKPRAHLWQQPARRIVAAGAPTWQVYSQVVSDLRTTDADLIQTPLRTADGAIAPAVADADVLITGLTPIDHEVVRRLANVRFVLRPYVGYDDIDVDVLTENGILFANVPDAFIEEVANHALGLILAVNRRLAESDAFVKCGRWSAGESNRTDVTPIRRTSTQTLGLVGFGNIARLVVERARPFGFRLIAADPYVSSEIAEAMGVEMMPLDQLMAESDIVSIHCLLNRETRGLIDARRIGLMKPGAGFVNTARGPIVREAALVEALQSGAIGGAGLDVFEVEPLPAESPLRGMRNVILSPHTASYSEEGDARHHQRTAEILRRVVEGQLPERKVVVNKDLYDALAEQVRTV
ncbi:MAG: C-terminal binding protein [Chloroflexota bacterium]